MSGSMKPAEAGNMTIESTLSIAARLVRALREAGFELVKDARLPGEFSIRLDLGNLTGSVRFVPDGREPDLEAIVREEEAEAEARRMSKSTPLRRKPKPPAAKFAPGTEVHVTAGRFSGARGFVLIAPRARDRAQEVRGYRVQIPGRRRAIAASESEIEGAVGG